MIQLVSENSDAQVARNRAIEELGWRLRDLTANLMRVTRGAGKPYAIGPQTVELVRCFTAYHDAAGLWPSSDEIARELKLDEHPDYLDRMSERNVDRHYAEMKVVKGSLQVAASQLLGQRTQERMGDHQMYGGVNDLADIREQERREHAARTPSQRRRIAKDAFDEALERSRSTKKRKN